MPSTSTPRVLGIFILALIGGAFWIMRRPSGPVNQSGPATSAHGPSTAQALKSEVAETEQPAVPAASTPSGASSPSTVSNAEVRATRAVYIAHAPLRTTEISNPDSEQNRQILQSMVEKALSRQKNAR